MTTMIRLSFYLFHGVFLANLSLTEGVSNIGNKFVVIFMENILDNSQQDLYILNPNTFPIDVQVSAPRSPDLGPLVEIQIPAGETKLVNVDARLNAIHTGISDHGILVESKDNITVQAYTQSLSTAESDSTGGFTVLPVEALGTEYMVVTHCETYYCQFAISSPVDISVDVNLKIKGTSALNFGGTSYYDGDTLSVDILAYQVLQLQVLEDLTGTLVWTSKPAAVFVGSDWTYIQPDKFDGQGDFMAEQMPPINTFGWNYVLVSFPQRSSEDWVNLVAAEENVVVKTSIGATIPINYREQIEINLLSGTGRYLNSTGRLIIVQYTKSPESKFVTNTDPSMIILHPIEQWKTPCPFVIEDIPPISLDSLVVIYANSTCRNSAQLSGTDIPTSYWTDIDDTGFITTTLYIINGLHTLHSSSSSCKGFSGYIYGRADNTALSLSFGAYVNIIHKPPNTSDAMSSSLRVESTNSVTLETSASEIDLSSLHLFSSRTSLVTAPLSAISTARLVIETVTTSNQLLHLNTNAASSLVIVAASQTSMFGESSSPGVTTKPTDLEPDGSVIHPSLSASYTSEYVSSSAVRIVVVSESGTGNELTNIMTSNAMNEASTFALLNSATYSDEDSYGTSQTMADGDLYITSQTMADADLYSTSQTMANGDLYSTSQTMADGDLYSTSQTMVNGDLYSTSQTMADGDLYSTSQTVANGDLYSKSQTMADGDLYSTSQTMANGDLYSTSQTMADADLYSTSQTMANGDLYSTSQTMADGDLYSTSQTMANGDLYSTSQTMADGDLYSTSQTMANGDVYSTSQTMADGDLYSTSQTMANGDLYSTSQTMASAIIASSASISTAASITIPTTTTTSLTTTDVSRKQFYICKCGCPETDEPLSLRIEHIKDELKIDASFLSKNIRKKISIPDERRSAAMIGWSAIVFIVVVLAVLALADVLSLYIYIVSPRKCAKKIIFLRE